MPSDTTGVNKLSPEEERRLLKQHEPILHFAKGEWFFPMKVEAFIEKSVLKYKEDQNKKKSNEAENYPPNLYFHYVHEHINVKRLHTYFLWIFSWLMFFLLWISIQPNNIRLYALGEGELNWLQLWTGSQDNIKFWLLAFSLTYVWPKTRGNRRVQSTIFLAFGLTFFLGTIVSVGFSFMAILVIFVIIIVILINNLIRKEFSNTQIESVDNPLQYQVVQPLSDRVVQHFKSQLIQPYKTQVVQPIRTRIVQPIRKRVVQPIKTRVVQPIRTRIIQPFRTRIVQPFAHSIRQQFQSQDDQPLTEDLLKLTANLFTGAGILIIIYITKNIVRFINSFLDFEELMINPAVNAMFKSNFNMELITEGLNVRFYLPNNIVTLINIVFILTIAGLVIWFILASVLVNIQKERFKNWFEKFSLDWESDIVPLLILLISSVVWGVTWWFFNTNRFLDSSMNHNGRTIAYSYLATIAASTLLWLYVDPLNPISNRLIGQHKQDNNGFLKPIFIIFFGFLVYFFSSLYLVRSELEISSHLIFSPLIILSTVVLIFYIAIGVSGPQLAGFVMNLQSGVPDSTAMWAKRKYEGEIVGSSDNNDFWYYGRVQTSKNWTILQYHYFYAYNDWRSACNGINQHEGDWEAVAIFLDRSNINSRKSEFIPIGVACSQHHDGDFRFWEDVERDESNLHPQIYVARGSHANYFEGAIYPTSMLLPRGLIRSIVDRIDGIVGGFRDRDNSLPQEIADGKGQIISNWKFEVMSNTSPDWVNYRGLWGKKSKHPDESGPTGPKWKRFDKDREKKQDSSYGHWNKEKPERLRWEAHSWKDKLILDLLQNPDVPTVKRRQALEYLVSTSQFFLE